MKDETIKSVTAIAGLVILECFALSEGIDGLLLGAVVAAVAGIAGYHLNDALRGGEKDKLTPN